MGFFFTHVGQGRCLDARGQCQTLRVYLRQRPGSPHALTTLQIQRMERPCCCQSLERVDIESRPKCEILGRGELPTDDARGLDPGYLPFPQVSHISQSQPDRHSRPDRIVDVPPSTSPALPEISNDIVGVGIDAFDGAVMP